VRGRCYTRCREGNVTCTDVPSPGRGPGRSPGHGLGAVGYVEHMSDLDNDPRIVADARTDGRQSEEAGDFQYDEAHPDNTEVPDTPAAQGTGAEPPD
jgi:hypothetical protein